MCYTNRQYDNRMKKLAELEEKKKALEAEIDAIINDLKADMGDMELVETGKWVIRWTKVSSNKFDSASFKKDHAALYASYQKPTSSRRFSYKTA